MANSDGMSLYKLQFMCTDYTFMFLHMYTGLKFKIKNI